MHHAQAHGQHFLRNKQVAYIGSGISSANRTITLWVNRAVIQHILSIFQVDCAFPCKKACVPCVSGRHNAIEEINAHMHCLKNITGRTHWDAFYSDYWNESAQYFTMNETLRPDFYFDRWQREKCDPHRIFVSQGDYPLKGLHYLLLALPAIRRKYPDVKVHVAGNSLVNYTTWKDKIKISAYGKYLRSIIAQNELQDVVTFLGSLTGAQMKEQYLEAGLFLCCSSMENSPNSLGEAMLLGVPCVSADVGGISSIFRDGQDGILFKGFKKEARYTDYDHIDYEREEKALSGIVKNLAEAVITMWSDEEACEKYCENARKHAEITHNKEENYKRLTEIYAIIGAK